MGEGGEVRRHQSTVTPLARSLIVNHVSIGSIASHTERPLPGHSGWRTAIVAPVCAAEAEGIEPPARPLVVAVPPRGLHIPLQQHPAAGSPTPETGLRP